MEKLHNSWRGRVGTKNVAYKRNDIRGSRGYSFREIANETDMEKVETKTGSGQKLERERKTVKLIFFF